MKSALQIAESIAEFIAELNIKYQQNPQQATAYSNTPSTLSFAQALMRQILNKPQFTDHPRHIVIIGPTQVGKSTLVNLLIGNSGSNDNEGAIVSPLAGYTQHIQGFATAQLSEAQLSEVSSLLPSWDKTSQKKLSSNNLQAWSIQESSHNPDTGPVHSIIWDTPDFDSVSSREYRTIVPALTAIADCIVLVVSKEKYADLSVWQLLEMITPIQKPLLICLNKVPPDHDDELTHAMQLRLKEKGIHHCNVTALPYESDYPTLIQKSEVVSQALLSCLPDKPQTSQPAVIRDWLQQHWDDWLKPAREENSAMERWKTCQKQYAETFIEYYQKNYHQQSRFSETLQKTIAQLLELLEIPIIAASLGRVRKIITWPARQLGGLIKNKVEHTTDNGNEEATILLEAHRHAWLEMQDSVLKHSRDATSLKPWWEEICELLTTQLTNTSARLEGSISDYQNDFKEDIGRASEQLYSYLKQHPTTLNSLRATRVTTDAAAVLLAVKTAGLSPSDLVLAPALLAVTSLLTESAVGSRVKQIEKDLKAKQLLRVSSELLEKTLMPSLNSITSQIDSNHRYLISNDRIEHITNLLDDWK